MFTAIFYTRFYRKLNTEVPFFTPGAIKYLEKYLKYNYIGFEYGAGIGTLWFSKLFVAEHNSEWYIKIKKLLEVRKISNTDVVLTEQENESFERYSKEIEKFPDNYFNLISIDEEIDGLLEKKFKQNKSKRRNIDN